MPREELETLMSQPGRGSNLDRLMAIDAAYTDYDVYLNDEPILNFILMGLMKKRQKFSEKSLKQKITIIMQKYLMIPLKEIKKDYQRRFKSKFKQANYR